MRRGPPAPVVGVVATFAVVALGAGAVGAVAWQDQPQDATPADPIGDILRTTPPVQVAPPSNTLTPVAEPPAPPPVVIAPPAPKQIAEAAPEPEPESPSQATPSPAAEPSPPGRRQRRPVAVVQAIDKITAETMQFEVEVGGRPVRFARNLIFSVRACESAASDEIVDDSVAYLEVALQPRGGQSAEPRQIFRGWMFASTPAVSGMQHPLYDAWVVRCKA